MTQFLIYSGQGISARLQYVLEWIFNEQLRAGFEITTDKTYFFASGMPKISYDAEPIAGDILHIPATTLLFEKHIQRQTPAIHRWKKTTILFYKLPGATLPFDLFAAIFYLISRYEEYLPCQKDRHNRFPAHRSIAGQYRFLKEPVVDQWLFHFRQLLSTRFNIQLLLPDFTVHHTFDIDLAWKYLYKGAARTWGGYTRDFLTGRWKAIPERCSVLGGKAADPYDNFTQLAALHREYQVQPLFFILLGAVSTYDKNTDPHHPAMKKLVKKLVRDYTCGIHPSYTSNSDTERLKEEIGLLSAIIGKPVNKSRQHYIKLTFPDTYHHLLDCGVTDDYSMGYPEQNGFRAGTSRPFFWYDLTAEKMTQLKIHPFIFMDATSLYYQQQDEEATWKEWMHFYSVLQTTHGQYISIWHNFILKRMEASDSWMPLYQKILSRSSKHSF